MRRERVERSDAFSPESVSGAHKTVGIGRFYAILSWGARSRSGVRHTSGGNRSRTRRSGRVRREADAVSMHARFEIGGAL